MKSRTKKNNKISVFLAFGKGIACADAIWPAMLFLHAGFKVYPVFLEGASEWVSEKAIYELCGFKPAYCTDISDGNLDNAKWLKFSKLNFGFGVFVNPGRDEILDYFMAEPKNKVLSFLKPRTDNTYLLLEGGFDAEGIDLNYYNLSKDVLKSRYFVKVFTGGFKYFCTSLVEGVYYIEDSIVFKNKLSSRLKMPLCALL